jgi:two-component system CheB/CheR fusion protein
LLNNAAKYTDSGGRIRLAARTDVEKRMVAIDVEDNGIGIPTETMPHIFDLFLQGAESRNRIWPGLGVGLPLAKYLVELHGGQLTATSAGQGQGSTFSIRLPLTHPDSIASAKKQEGIVTAATPRLRILVVDDDKDVAESTAFLLEESGHQVDIAHNGAAAIELALAHRPALVLLDIGLPGMDGYEVAQRLRERPELDATWIVALTGWGQDQDRRSSKAAGFDHHLVKPVDMATLDAVIRACASARHGAGSN